MQNIINRKCLIAILGIAFYTLTSISDVGAQVSTIYDFNRANDILVQNEHNDTLKFPFAGGLNSCQFANLDINLDGIDDLLVFDRHGNKILPFIIIPSLPVEYRFAPEYSNLFPKIEHWMQTVDYNRDGKKDIFCYTTGGIKAYRNDSDGKLKFTLVTQPFLLSLQGTTLTNILITYADYPALVDVDKDGDMDVLTFWGLGSFVEWHRNTSMERFGHADSLTFIKASSCWGRFAEGKEDNEIIFDTCSAYAIKRSENNILLNDPKHTGSTLLIHDMNGDGLPDITIGDVDYSSLLHLTNGGTLANAKMLTQTANFPNTSDPVNLNTFPAAMLVDVDNDGKKDLVVSPFDPSLTKGENYKSISVYKNESILSQPNYQLVSKSFLQDEMIDLGSGAYPVFFDYNKDGLMDILVGNYGYYDTCIYTPETGLQCSYVGQVALLLNVGTKSKPAFRITDRNIAKLDALQMQSLIPAIADMDGDGDADLICGNSKGKFVYCENIAPQGQPAEFKLVDPAWQSIDVGDFSAPQLLDVDKDGLIDLVSGKRNGSLSFYKNIGSAQSASFILVTESFGGVDVTNPQLSNYGYSVPCFYKNPDGKTMLLIGSEYGEISAFDQIDGNLNGNFRFLGTFSSIKEGLRSSIAVGNLNNDTLADMVVGNYSGGIGVFTGKPGHILSTEKPIQAFEMVLHIAPNPACKEVEINVNTDVKLKPEEIRILGMDGKTIRKFSDSNLPLKMDISDFRNGIYIVMIQTNKGIIKGKLIVCR